MARPVLILLIISVFFVWLGKSKTFKVDRVNIFWDEGKFSVPEAESRLRENINHRLIFLVGNQQIITGMGDFPVIQSVLIKKIYPTTVNLSILTRKSSLVVVPTIITEGKFASPSAIIQLGLANPLASKSAETYLLDSSGLVFWKGLNDLRQDLTKFLLARDISLKVGQRTVDESIQAGLKFVTHYQNLSADSGLPKISFLLSTSRANLVVKLANGTLVYIPVADAYEDLFDSLRLILNKYQIEGKHLKKVDLRFKNPVVEY